MSLDLFFVPRTPSFETLRAPEYQPTAAQKKARCALIAALLEAYPATSLHGEASEGRIEGFSGELELRPGYVLWSLKHVDADETSQVQAVVDWFASQRLVCEDVQGAGFGNRRPKTDSTLDSLDALVVRTCLVCSSTATGPRH